MIGRAVQSLYRAQIFPDGDRQSTVFMVMNRMLLDAGLPPAIIGDPRAMFGYSDEVTGVAIRAAQNTFRTSFPNPESELESQRIIINVTDMKDSFKSTDFDRASDSNDNSGWQSSDSNDDPDLQRLLKETDEVS